MGLTFSKSRKVVPIRLKGEDGERDSTYVLREMNLTEREEYALRMIRRQGKEPNQSDYNVRGVFASLLTLCMYHAELTEDDDVLSIGKLVVPGDIEDLPSSALGRIGLEAKKLSDIITKEELEALGEMLKNE